MFHAPCWGIARESKKENKELSYRHRKSKTKKQTAEPFSGRQSRAASPYPNNQNVLSQYPLPHSSACSESLFSHACPDTNLNLIQHFWGRKIWKELHCLNCPRPYSSIGWLCLPQQVECLIEPSGKFSSLEKLAYRDLGEVQVYLNLI